MTVWMHRCDGFHCFCAKLFWLQQSKCQLVHEELKGFITLPLQNLSSWCHCNFIYNYITLDIGHWLNHSTRFKNPLASFRWKILISLNPHLIHFLNLAKRKWFCDIKKSNRQIHNISSPYFLQVVIDRFVATAFKPEATKNLERWVALSEGWLASVSM